jgi:malate dehydrogenase (oxaloacetate-decarboxylating)(NADP+)
MSPPEHSCSLIAIGLIYPPTSNILDASLRTAGRIAEYIFDHGLAGVARPDDIDAHAHARAYKPAYPARV